jgi:2-amino-4-hydroxy-6-hydroxymethyldihydropteridine diphosphokinase
MAVAYLLLGSNLGDRENFLRQGLQLLLDANSSLIKLSSIYESEAWGYTDSNIYLNVAVQLNTTHTPEQMLQKCKSIENRLGRVKNSDSYEARTIDMDIIFYGSEIYQSDNLQIPHPQVQHRKFVLLPLTELCPDFLHPVLSKTVKQLLTDCTDSGRVKKQKSLSGF